ncbi:MAG: 23S rRNA (pseudouridine(1915)-N(3))-methyltransferase RlmH [Candidatus Omnitrophica bacterium]|nr:23S rRNA (pseudouridine(1915)-N(3))-methyltransferase RlmH [Candidatus Omnitrophota bacterium]
MQIKIISLQRHPQQEIEMLEREYLKRLSVMAKVEVVNIRPKTDARDKAKTLREEEKLIQKILAGDENLVVLDAAGKEMTTPDLSEFLDKHMKSGTKKLTFLIGGPQGLSPALVKRAGLCWALSKLTFPHRLVRLMIIEALYRAMDVVKGGNYHKE